MSHVNGVCVVCNDIIVNRLCNSRYCVKCYRAMLIGYSKGYNKGGGNIERKIDCLSKKIDNLMEEDEK